MMTLFKFIFSKVLRVNKEPDIVIAAGDVVLNPRKKFTTEEIQELIPKIDVIRKQYGIGR